VSHSPVSIPDQPRCKYCGEIIPAGDRRPRQFCSDACRKAAARAEAKERARRPKRLRRPISPSKTRQRPNPRNPKKSASHPPEINGLISGQNRTSAPLVPLNVFGRGYRWPGAKTNGNAVRIAAAVDAELGAGAEWLTSPGGALYQVIPSRRAR
jgi:hypothetical protein